MLMKTSLANELKRLSNKKLIPNGVGQSSKPTQVHIDNLNDCKRFEQRGFDFFSSKTNEFFSVVDRNCLNLAPILLKHDNLDEFERLQRSLHQAVKQIVSNYDCDERIRTAFGFSPRIERIFALYKNRPFRFVGSYRPDFLYEQSTCTPKLCEINARFVLNGYLITLFGNEFYSKHLDFFPNSASYETIEQTKCLLESFQNEFNMSKPIAVLKKREKGNDIRFIQDFFPNVLFSSPDLLELDKKNRRLFINSQTEQTVDQFLLELHQDEILQLDDSVLSFMIESCKLLNDLRTIFIVHDKRFLTLLCQDDLLEDYLNKSEHETIRRHRLISLNPSRLKHERNLKQNVLKEKEKWLIKPRQYGKGEGILFGKNMTQSEWSESITNVINSNEFILQEYLKQEKFELSRHQFQSPFDNKAVEYNLVGTLLCLNEKFLGPGIFRASSKDLIALKQGGDVLFPIKEKMNPQSLEMSCLPQLVHMQSKYEPLEVPEKSKFVLKQCSFENVEKYEKSLLENGLVLIQFDSNEDILSNGFFLSLIQHLGVPFSHSKLERDFIWDIKPSRSDLKRPRSQTDEEFQMHTDASFEPTPPRYFALYVIKSDQFGGGQSLLLDLESILKRLTDKEIRLLMNTPVKFKIPGEFRKDENEFTIGSLLSPRRDSMNRILCRYRQDVLIDREQMDLDYKKALDKFEELIDLEKGRKLIKCLTLNNNSILIVDNSIWLHGRTKILDQNRHLVRIRFQTRNNLLLPW